MNFPVIPAKAGIPLLVSYVRGEESGIPAFAGMTEGTGKVVSEGRSRAALPASPDATKPVTTSENHEATASVEQLLALVRHPAEQALAPPGPSGLHDSVPVSGQPNDAKVEDGLNPAPIAEVTTVPPGNTLGVTVQPPVEPQPPADPAPSGRTRVALTLVPTGVEAAATPATADIVAAVPTQAPPERQRQPALLERQEHATSLLSLAAPARPEPETAQVSAIAPTRQETPLTLPIADWTKPASPGASDLPTPLPLAPTQPMALASLQSTAQASAPAELLIEHQLDLAADGAWLDQLARDIAAAGEEGAPLRFRLNPETLGSLRVEITQARDGAAIRLTADTEAARAIIADAQPRLLAEARAQGVRIAEAHVDLGQGGASADSRRQQAPQSEPQLRTARLLQGEPASDGKPTERRSDRFA